MGPYEGSGFKGLSALQRRVNFRLMVKGLSAKPDGNEQPRRKRRGIKWKILNAPRGGELNPRPPQAD